MSSVKIKFRASSVNGGKGTVFYQIIHNRVVRQIRTGYRIHEWEWNSFSSEIVIPASNNERAEYLMKVNSGIQNDLYRLQKIIVSLDVRGWPYDADDVVSEFASARPQHTLFDFIESLIADKRSLGKVRAAETYASALNSFRRFRNGADLMMNNIDSDMMLMYEAYLRARGLKPNSSSFYMRNLRAVYNIAVEKGMTIQRHPFRHVYTGVEKTVKRAVPINIIRKVKALDLADKPRLDFARDIFLFSFYTRGMAFVDMAYLRKKDLSEGVLSYRRRKTGQQLFIKWEKCMQEIVDKHQVAGTERMLPIIRRDTDERKQYIYEGHNINRNLKIIGRILGLSAPLTMYVARHAWASIAKSRNVPLSVISEGMGHDSENTTRIYLASLDNAAIDKANSMILKLI